MQMTDRQQGVLASMGALLRDLNAAYEACGEAERKVADLVAEGVSGKDIKFGSDISEYTAHRSLTILFSRFDVTTSRELQCRLNSRRVLDLRYEVAMQAFMMPRGDRTRAALLKIAGLPAD